MNDHSATFSCSVELYKQWFTLADFFPNWNFCGVFISFAVTRRKDQNPIKIGLNKKVRMYDRTV
jgi:hypothetical protein